MRRRQAAAAATALALATGLLSGARAEDVTEWDAAAAPPPPEEHRGVSQRLRGRLAGTLRTLEKAAQWREKSSRRASLQSLSTAFETLRSTATGARLRGGASAEEQAKADEEAAELAEIQRKKKLARIQQLRQEGMLDDAAALSSQLSNMAEVGASVGAAAPPPTPAPAPRGPSPEKQAQAAARIRSIVSTAAAAGEGVVIYLARYGLGNRIGGLLQSAALAHSAGARLHVVWTRMPECDAPYGALFAPPSSDRLTVEENGPEALTPDLAAMPMGLKEVDLALLSPPYYPMSALWGWVRERDQEPNADWANGDSADHSGVEVLANANRAAGGAERVVGDLERSLLQDLKTHKSRLPFRFRQARDLPRVEPLPARHALAMWARRRKSRLRRPVSVLYHTDRCNAEPAAVQAATQYFGIRVHDQVLDRAVAFSAEEGVDQSTVGVHLRSTDVREPLDMPRIVADIRQRFGGRRLFVCSDEKEAELEIVRLFQAARLPKTEYATKGDPSQPWRLQGGVAECNCTFNYHRSSQSIRDALVDLLILARTEQPDPPLDGLVAHSTFRLAAIWMRNAGLHTQAAPQ